MFILIGTAEERLCPDGLVFADENPNKELCDIPSNVDCGDRKELRKYSVLELRACILMYIIIK